MFKTQCDQCFKEFSSDVSEMAARRSLTGHAARTGHSTKVLIQNQVDRDYAAKENSVDEPTNIDEAKAERKAAREAAAAEKAEAKAKAAEERAAAKAAREAPRTEPCECGCGGIPAGRKSRFLPGHDAKKASAEKAAAAAK